MTSFYKAIDNVSTTTTGYTAGSGSITLAAGTGSQFGSTFPLVISTFLADGTTPKGVYSVAGRSTDNLTGLALLAGTDSNLASGAVVAIVPTAEHFAQITGAINSLESSLAADEIILAAHTSSLATKAVDTAVVHNTGSESIAGVKTFLSTIVGSVSGNAGTATNGVVTTTSYANPAWITSLAGSKITGDIAGNAAGLSANIAESQVTGLVSDLAAKAPLASPSFTGTVTVGTLAGLLKGTDGAISAATAGTDYLAPSGSGAALTGILGSQIGGTVAIANGGTGQATANDALNALLPSQTGNATKVLQTDGTDTSWAAAGSGDATLAGSQTFTGAKTFGASITSALGTITTSQPALTATQTWNAGGVTFTGLLLNVTDSASAAGSLFVDMQVAGSSKFKVTKAGAVTCVGLTVTGSGSNFNFVSSGNSVSTNGLCGVIFNSTNCTVFCSSATDIPFIVRATASHSADLVRVVNSSSTVLFAFDNRGRPFAANTTPTIAAGTGAGTAPTVSVSGTDVSGVISVTTGTTPSASATVATISASSARGAAPKSVILTPANAAAAALTGNAQVYVDSASTGTTDFLVKVGSTNLAASTAYLWHFLVL